MKGTAAHDEETLAAVARAAANFAVPDAKRSRHVRDTADGHDPVMWSRIADQGWLGSCSRRNMVARILA